MKDQYSPRKEDNEIRAIVDGFKAKGSGFDKLTHKCSEKNAAVLVSQKFNRQQIASEGLQYELLDQLTMEILMGIR
jgi:hypothetical protein